MKLEEQNAVTAFLAEIGRHVVARQLLAISALGLDLLADAQVVETPAVWERAPGVVPRLLDLEAALVVWFAGRPVAEAGPWRITFTPRTSRHWPPIFTFEDAF